MTIFAMCMRTYIDFQNSNNEDANIAEMVLLGVAGSSNSVASLVPQSRVRVASSMT